MGRWLAGRLMKELGLVSCQQPTHRYKRGGHEHVAIPNHLERQFAVTQPKQADQQYPDNSLTLRRASKAVIIRAGSSGSYCGDTGSGRV